MDHSQSSSQTSSAPSLQDDFLANTHMVSYQAITVYARAGVIAFTLLLEQPALEQPFLSPINLFVATIRVCTTT